MNNETLSKLAMGGFACIGIASFGFATIAGIKMKKMEKMLTTAAVNIDQLTTVDIEQSIIDRTVKNVVDREVSNCVAKATDRIYYSMRNSIDTKLNNVVNEQYENIKSTVAEKIAYKADHLDIGSIRNEAKVLMIKKFNGQLDDLIEDFGKNLTNVRKIYESIAGSMAMPPKTDISFKL